MRRTGFSKPRKPMKQRSDKRKSGPAIKSTKKPLTPLQRAAEGQDCKLRITGVCSHDPAKVVLCHVRMAGFCGTGMKSNDVHAYDGCFDCHNVQEHKSKWDEHGLTYEHVLRAVMKTQLDRISKGLISVKE